MMLVKEMEGRKKKRKDAGEGDGWTKEKERSG